MKRRTLLALIASTALALGALVVLPSSASAAPRPSEIAPCYGVRYTPPPPAPGPKKPARPAKPRAK